MSTTPKKRNWKKIGLIVGIIILLIVSVFVSIKLYKIVKNKRVLKKAQEELAQGGNSSGGGGSAGGGGSSGGTDTDEAPNNPPPAPSGLTQYQNIKVGDKLWAASVSYGYSQAPGTGGQTLGGFFPVGNYVGQVISKSGGTLFVRNWTGGPTNSSGQMVRDFYVAPKAYIVKP
jgi:hypothetical protein